MLLTHRKLLQSKVIAIENDLRGTFRSSDGCSAASSIPPERSLFRAPFPALWSAPAPAQALVREYGRGSGPFRGCRLVSNRADALSCRSFLQ
jgi:hypothetical protein